MTDTKQTRTPKGAASITKGALALPLAERIELAKALAKANQDEVAALKAQAENAAKLLG